jgi:AhpD family alkylhydroperoxidase
MRNLRLGLIAVALAAVATAELATAQRQTQTPPPPSHGQTQGTKPGKQGSMRVTATTPDEVLRDVQKTFGFVPEFIRVAPRELLVGFWASLKNFQMNPATQLDAKTKELIGLAVAAQIPCEYCVYFHTQAARKNGATEQEVKEALGMAAVTRMASTMINGSQVDRTAFRRDTDRILKGAEQMRSQARQGTTRTR